jgi:hypothetical protein
MIRKIIEDIRPNKRKIIPSMEEIILPVKEIVPNEVNKEKFEEIKAPTKVGVPTEVGEKKIYSRIEVPTEVKREKKEGVIEKYFKRKALERQRLQRTPQVKIETPVLHRTTFIILVLTILFGGIYWSGIIFQKADITITSKHQLISYNNKQFNALPDSNSDTINFEIMITSDKKLKNMTLTDSKNVSTKAEGSITLYNEFSTKSQKIVAGTFLSDNNGKAYKTNKVVTIPGYKTDKNKKIIPGQISADITAFLPGDAYNGTPSDFHVNSFKNTTKYLKIYGKLKTPLTGGAVGLIYTLNDSDKNMINILAQTTLKDDFLGQVKSLVPPGYILYPNALSYSYKIEDNISSKTPNTDVEIDETLSVVLLKEKSLVDNIIKISLPSIKSDEVKEIKISDLNNLVFNFTNKDQLITKDMTTLYFSFSGDINAIWSPDVELLKTKLIGINKNDVPSVFRQDPGIASALLKIFPPWQKYIPDDISKINVILN